jgi:putative heme-binding domain-containing protein
MAALTSMPGREAEAFATLAGYVKSGEERDAAVRALRNVPRAHWPRDQARPLIDAVARYVEKLPDRQRAEPGALDALQLANDLTFLLPVAEAKQVRARLGELGVNVVLLRAVPHKMVYDRSNVYVEAGKPVVLVFDNTDIMPHNVVIGMPNSLTELGQAADLLATNPNAQATHYVPKHPKVLHHTRLLQPREVERLHFTAPKVPGEYVYVCTFPGHWRLMFGTLHVVPKLSDVPEDLLQPPTVVEARPFVKNWSYDELAADLDRMGTGRSFKSGRELFKAASCVQCHRTGGDPEGGIVGPDLAETAKKVAGGKLTRAELLREVIDPSKVIHEQYKSWIIVTGKGDLVTGVIVGKDGKKLRVVANPLAKPVEVDEDDIESKEPAKVSMMPQGLLVTLDREEIMDLLAYVAAGGDARHPAFTRRED